MAKHAAIDMGSNTLLLLIVDDSSGQLVPIVDECDFGRLGQGLSTSKALHPDAVQRSLEIVKRYRALIDEHQVESIAAVGTQALREAENRADFIGPAEQLLGCSIEIIAGEREAQLVARAVAESFPARCREELITVDVGGASTEFIVIRAGEVVSVTSIAIGAVRLSERYLGDEAASPEQAQALFAGIDEAIAELDLPQSVPVVGSAGTATSIASIRLGLRSYAPERIHGMELTPEEVAETTRELLAMSVEEKKTLPGLEPKRADVIAGGVAIYSRVLQRVQAPLFLVSDRGVRWGLAHEIAGP